MSKATTIALLERRPDISRDLFSRYWRDVHGVMAARIPGFESYVQHHVAPLEDMGSAIVEPFEGIAVVTFANPGDRDGLIHSPVTSHIHRDEQNVFRRALLYNLEADATSIFGDADRLALDSYFLVLPLEVGGIEVAKGLTRDGAIMVAFHDLSGADPAGWNDTDVEEGGASRLFGAVIQCWWSDLALARAALADAVRVSLGRIACYRTDERYLMVEQGRPTLIGLRGLDAVRTIEEAGAVNQREPEVLRAIYGAVAG
ncbi:MULTISPECIES: EthD domain-containing protein [unclassified Sphingobium]|uniref:EthD domain-containing protein n=1 Tax=unclassified Sphingobium TaxID=2611147 RepID=UPI00159C7A54|nr:MULTISPECIES: EthD domain-containing protein [unclassified Sphingobium]MCB4859787.1 EthD domain-containing protein [Sphingobium sp. PNB]